MPLKDQTLYFTNQFLIAMPLLTDSYFTRGVTYICEHNDKGAIGIVINQPLKLQLATVFEELAIENVLVDVANLPVLSGGPLHPERGFVLHSPDTIAWRSSLAISSEIVVTTSRDILQAIAQRQGPHDALIALGYARWDAGQLEAEIINNIWLTAPANSEILFRTPFNERWEAAIHSLGIDLTKLADIAGHA